MRAWTDALCSECPMGVLGPLAFFSDADAEKESTKAKAANENLDTIFAKRTIISLESRRAELFWSSCYYSVRLSSKGRFGQNTRCTVSKKLRPEGSMEAAGS